MNPRELDEKLPENGYWKYSYLWTNTTSWISFLASLTHYLEHEKLASKEEVEKLVGLEAGPCNTLKLDIEEYLIGLTHLSNELVIDKLLDSYQVIVILIIFISVTFVSELCHQRGLQQTREDSRVYQLSQLWL